MIVFAKLTSKNQLTIPTAVTAAVEATECFDVTTEKGRFVSTVPMARVVQSWPSSGSRRPM